LFDGPRCSTPGSWKIRRQHPGGRVLAFTAIILTRRWEKQRRVLLLEIEKVDAVSLPHQFIGKMHCKV